MANFNIGFDCTSQDDAVKIHDYIASLDLFQDGLQHDEERVSLISKQGLIDEVSKFCADNSVSVEVEVWPEGMDYDEAESDMEFFSFPK